MTVRSRLPKIVALAMLPAIVLGGCRSKGDLVLDEGVGVTAVRTPCPAVGIPDYTGDITLFRTPGDVTQANLDVIASITNVRSQCSLGTDKVVTQVGFDVLARRMDTRGQRDVVLPYFVTVLRGGTSVTSKRVGTVTLSFADGQERAQARAQGSSTIDRSEATLPEEVRRRIVRKRKSGEADAAVDPLSEPDVKLAVSRATFELLVGFQLDQRQLAYNATR